MFLHRPRVKVGQTTNTRTSVKGSGTVGGFATAELHDALVHWDSVDAPYLFLGEAYFTVVVGRRQASLLHCSAPWALVVEVASHG